MATQRFLVTGGSQGIGAALVTHARKAGHHVVFTGRKEAAIKKVAADTGAHGIAADIAVDADNARTVEACASHMGGVDVLINNAGVGYSAEIGALDVDARLTMSPPPCAFISGTMRLVRSTPPNTLVAKSARIALTSSAPISAE